MNKETDIHPARALTGAFAGPSTQKTGKAPLVNIATKMLHPRMKSLSMVTRVNTWRVIDPAALRSRIEQKRAAIAALPGLQARYTSWKPNGEGLKFAVYQSEQAMAAADPLVEAIWAEFAPLFSTKPETQAYADMIELKAGAC